MPDITYFKNTAECRLFLTSYQMSSYAECIDLVSLWWKWSIVQMELSLKVD